jgi:anaerobic selenocysteine-containing dehydrogenase
MKLISACTMDCPDGCSFLVETRPDGSRKVRGNPDHPFTQGFCCPKGAGYIDRFLRRPDRILRPMLKTGDGFEAVSWERALSLCAEKIQSLRDDPRRILHARGHGARGILWKASTTWFRTLGATGLRGALCDEAGIEASTRDFGSLNHDESEELLGAARIVNWGKDPVKSSIHVAALIGQARKKGARVLTITPGGDETGALTDHRIQIRPGTDRFLTTAVIQLMKEAKGFDPALLGRAANADAFFSAIEAWPLEKALEICGVSLADAREIAAWYLGDGPTATLIGWGLQRYKRGGETVRFINALAFLTGQVGRRGAGVYFNLPSARNLKDLNPDGSYGRTLVLPDLARELAQADPPIRMAWIESLNLANQAPDAYGVIAALQKIDFVVAVEAFWNDTALRAHLVLPPALMMEREDVVGAAGHHYLNHSGRAFDPPAEVRSDFEILSDLGRRLSPPILLPPAEECLIRGLEKVGGAAALTELRTRGWMKTQWPSPSYENLIFDHPDGRYRFPETLNGPEPVDSDYPLRLLTLVDKHNLHSQIPEKDQTGLPTVWVSPNCPCAAGIDSGRPIDLVTRLGRLRALLAWDETLHPEAVVVRRGGWLKHGRGVNHLIEAHITDMGENAAQYEQGARLEKV